MITKKRQVMERIVAGIVTYNPNMNRFCQCLESIVGQVEEIIIIDNGSDNNSSICELVQKYLNVKLKCNNENIGIAAALNQIFYYAHEKGYELVLTLDDDSVCEKDMLSQILPYLMPEDGIICPMAVDDKMDNTAYYEKEEENSVVLVEDCITAGSITRVSAWERVGKFDEKMFIDFVDIEFCKRLRISGYTIRQVRNSKIHQEYGNLEGSFSLFGRKLYCFQYSPKRVYYSVRNQIYYMRKHKENLNIPYHVLYLIGYIGKRVVFEKNRRKSLKAIGKGIYDGIKM